MPEFPPPDFLPLIREFLPEISEAVIVQLGRLTALVRSWNARVNLVSRKDVDQLEEHHLLHSLLAAKVFRPAAGARVVDLGTGGGFPGLPLAMLFPQARFTLVDSIAKKGRAVGDIAAALGLPNVHIMTARAETLHDRFDFVFGRAVAALPEFLRWAAPLLAPGARGEPVNGVFYFKGTLWREELAGSPVQPSSVWSLHEFVPRPFFAEKFLLHFAAPPSAAG